MNAVLEKTNALKTVVHTSYTQERPLFGAAHMRLEEASFSGPGESALKECRNIEAVRCHFDGKYPLWHNQNTQIADSVFTENARAAIWYCENVAMKNTRVDAPKMFREVDGLSLENVQLPNALECLWNCRNARLRRVDVQKGDYLFINGKNLYAEDFTLQGNYSFQYTQNVRIRRAKIHSKDAFWNSENVTVEDSELTGEYLGWHSKNLRLVNCKISGTQPLCYAQGLVLENCIMTPDCDLCFEYASLQADIKGNVASVKNPRTGVITADGYGEIILDRHIKSPGDCRIIRREGGTDEI